MKKPHHIADSNLANKIADNKWEIWPKGLNIVWGDDPRYWNLEKDPHGNATLIQVSWLDVSGSVEVPKGKYRVTFEVQLKPDAFGWTGSPVLVMAKVGKKGQYQYSETTLNNDASKISVDVEVRDTNEEKKIYFGLYEVWSGKWKGGLVIKKVNVGPPNP
ncbi:protein PHLOEM PROTEIN 2-LIKE A9-like [Prosopis cineraria]|uniref:protein PHLOEM PROTEIN 2-LIKE A9-like n=1 Tax=Prosopis cineraria TaxID=364024 RepID=UPI00240EBCC1|nr:protein PHLOEM PROTEIN 2-LIKE A9-like [Prosopis cineraria]